MRRRRGRAFVNHGLTGGAVRRPLSRQPRGSWALLDLHALPLGFIVNVVFLLWKLLDEPPASSFYLVSVSAVLKHSMYRRTNIRVIICDQVTEFLTGLKGL